MRYAPDTSYLHISYLIPRHRHRILPGKIPVEVFVVAGDGNHGGIVRAELEPGDVRVPTFFFPKLFKAEAQSSVGGDAPGNGDFPDSRLSGGQMQFFSQNADDAGLHRGADVGQVGADEIRLFPGFVP